MGAFRGGTRILSGGGGGGQKLIFKDILKNKNNLGDHSLQAQGSSTPGCFNSTSRKND
jgi:hypothetical protein